MKDESMKRIVELSEERMQAKFFTDCVIGSGKVNEFMALFDVEVKPSRLRNVPPFEGVDLFGIRERAHYRREHKKINLSIKTNHAYQSLLELKKWGRDVAYKYNLHNKAE